MTEKADVVFYKGVEGWVKIGEIQMAEDGTLNGQIYHDGILGLPEVISKSRQPYVVALSLLPAQPATDEQVTTARVDREPRLDRLRSGNWQFGCAGTHMGMGTGDCPRERHHHHDEFCQLPSVEELVAAGIDPQEFKNKRRGRSVYDD